MRAPASKSGISDAAKAYAAETLDPLLEEMFNELLQAMPPDPLQFMAHWLSGRDDGRACSTRAQERTQATLVVKQYPFLGRVLREMVQEILAAMPPNLVRFMRQWLERRRTR